MTTASVLKAWVVIFYICWLTVLRFPPFLSSALPLVYSDNCNQLLLWSIHKWRETRLRPREARLRRCSVKPLWSKRETKPHIRAAQIWVSGGFVLLWSMTQASMKIALCLKCIVWQLAIKTSSVVMHGGVWRPEDLLSKLCTVEAVMEIFILLQKVLSSIL